MSKLFVFLVGLWLGIVVGYLLSWYLYHGLIYELWLRVLNPIAV